MKHYLHQAEGTKKRKTSSDVTLLSSRLAEQICHSVKPGHAKHSRHSNLTKIFTPVQMFYCERKHHNSKYCDGNKYSDRFNVCMCVRLCWNQNYIAESGMRMTHTQTHTKHSAVTKDYTQITSMDNNVRKPAW